MLQKLLLSVTYFFHLTISFCNFTFWSNRHRKNVINVGTEWSLYWKSTCWPENQCTMERKTKCAPQWTERWHLHTQTSSEEFQIYFLKTKRTFFQYVSPFKVISENCHHNLSCFWTQCSLNLSDFGLQEISTVLNAAQSSMSSETPATVACWCWTRLHFIHSLDFHTLFPLLQPLIFILTLLVLTFSHCFFNPYHVPLDISIDTFEERRWIAGISFI